MPDLYWLTEPQLERILAAINASQGSVWLWWFPVVSVFVSALLAMVVGILLEQYKAYRVRLSSAIERQKSEISKINITIVSYGFNFESVHTVAIQYFIDSYKQTLSFYNEVKGLKNQEDMECLAQIPFSTRYPAVVITCPEVFLIETDLLKDVPFIVEKDAEILKDSGWIIDQGREPQAAIKNYNETVMLAWHATNQMDGLPTSLLENFLQRQMVIAKTQCLLSHQLLDLLIKTIRKCEKINGEYRIPAKKSRVTISDKLEITMGRLREIAQISEPKPAGQENT